MTYQVPEHVDLEAVDDEAVLLDSRSDIFLSLNATATIVWRAIQEGRSEEEAAGELVAVYGIEPDIARADVNALLADLVARGLLERHAT